VDDNQIEMLYQGFQAEDRATNIVYRGFLFSTQSPDKE